jgi:hypothetical protein
MSGASEVPSGATGAGSPGSKTVASNVAVTVDTLPVCGSLRVAGIGGVLKMTRTDLVPRSVCKIGPERDRKHAGMVGRQRPPSHAARRTSRPPSRTRSVRVRAVGAFESSQPLVDDGPRPSVDLPKFARTARPSAMYD